MFVVEMLKQGFVAMGVAGLVLYAFVVPFILALVVVSFEAVVVKGMFSDDGHYLRAVMMLLTSLVNLALYIGMRSSAVLDAPNWGRAIGADIALLVLCVLQLIVLELFPNIVERL